jgi:DNA replication protein DnaC
VNERIREIIERFKQVADSPEFRANAAKLRELDTALEAYARESRRKIAGIPVEHARRLDTPGDSHAFTAALSWVSDPQRTKFLVLGGRLGVGKSFAAAWCVDQLGGRFASMPDVAARKFDAEDVEALLSAHCLALDDVGTESVDAGGWQESHLYRVLQGRYAQGRPTVLTTNLWGEELRARLGSEILVRVWDRMLASGIFVLCDGESMRGREVAT